MATLMMTLSSDEEDNVLTKKERNNDDDDEDVDSDFEFGGIMGEDNDNELFGSMSNKNWSYKSALAILAEQDLKSSEKEFPRTTVSSIIEAARKNIKKEQQEIHGSNGNEKKTDKDESDESVESDDENKEDDDDSSDGSDDNSESESESDDDEIDDKDANKKMETDIVRDQMKKKQTKKEKKEDKEEDEKESESQHKKVNDDDSEDSENSENSDDDSDSENEEIKKEAAKAEAFFEKKNNEVESIEIFSQLNLSRPLLRGVASMGFVTPTPIQASVIPPTLSGRDICASAVTGSGKTAAFLLPMLEKILQSNNSNISTTKALIITPTRELAAQCLGMLHSLCNFCHNIRSCLIVGGNRNIPSQATELRTHPDIVICTPGRMLDHLTNSSGVLLDDLEFLVLDEADRLLDLGFQEEILEIVKSCPKQRQTLLFSATMTTKVDDLVKLSLKKPIRIQISNKDKRITNQSTSSSSSLVEVAPRLEQEFIRIRSSNENKREAILLSLLTRTFQKIPTIVFFDTKQLAHRLRIICGLCGIQCSELHGNLTQTQRLEALEEFRNGEVYVLLATDLAARGLDINTVQAVINFDMPNKVETYVHRIGRTARAGRTGKSCTLIGEGRRFLMKEVIKDAQEKNIQTANKAIIRSRTVPTAVIDHFYAKIQSLESHIKEVLAAEAVARMDRLANMEATKATNIILHSDSIHSRPAREWFKGKQEKQNDEIKQREKYINEEGTGKHRMTRKKRRAREAKQSLKYHQEQEQKERIQNNLDPLPIFNEKSMKIEAKSLKKQEQQKQRELFQRSIHDEDLVREAKLKKKMKKDLKRKQLNQDSIGDSNLFDYEQVSYAKKSKLHDEYQKSDYQFTAFDPNKKFGKGGKKTNKSFKSKTKYKRR